MVGMKALLCAVCLVVSAPVFAAQPPEQWAGPKWEYATLTYEECRQADTFKWLFSSRLTVAAHFLAKPTKTDPGIEAIGAKLTGKTFPKGTGLSQENWTFNAIGELGWELVAVRRGALGYLDATETVYIFKRPLQ